MEEKMASPEFYSFLETLAQVTFTAVGLVLVAIAADAETRNYWFGDKTRSLYVGRMFFHFLFPGFYSVMALIPHSPEGTEVPFWIAMAITFGLLYLILPGIILLGKKKIENSQELSRLEKVITSGSVQTWIGAFLFITGIIALAANPLNTKPSYIEPYIASALGASLFFSVLQIALLFKESTRATKKEQEAAKQELTKNLMAESQSKPDGLPILMFIFSMLFTFLAGLILSNNVSRRNHSRE